MKQKLSRADIQQLHQLGSMKEKGILTQEEFTTEKGMLLDQDGRKAQRPSIWIPWLAGAVAVLLLIIAIVGLSSAPSAHKGSKPVTSEHH